MHRTTMTTISSIVWMQTTTPLARMATMTMTMTMPLVRMMTTSRKTSKTKTMRATKMKAALTVQVQSLP